MSAILDRETTLYTLSFINKQQINKQTTAGTARHAPRPERGWGHALPERGVIRGDLTHPLIYSDLPALLMFVFPLINLRAPSGGNKEGRRRSRRRMRKL